MPVYQVSRSTWQVKVWHLGRQHKRLVHGTKRDAEAREVALRLELAETPAEPRAAAPTFLRFCAEAYLPHAELRLRASWLRNQRYTLATICEHAGELPVDAITPALLEDYARQRVAAGLRHVSVNNELRVYRRVLSYAVELGIIERVPRLAALREDGERRVRAWTEEEMARLLDACARVAPAILGMVVLLANTGMRRGEALALTWERVDLERGLLEIWPSDAWQPKNNKPREVPISDALRPWLQLPRRGTYVFPTRKGTRFAVWPARLFDRARDAAGIAGGVHQLRHTFASRFLAACPDLELLAAVLGHSGTAVTRLYAHLLPDHLSRARNAVQVLATPAAAEALAVQRWRADRAKTVPETVPERGGEGGVDDGFTVGAGYGIRTRDIKLGKLSTKT